ncbi:receptor-like protein EIX1 [Neltuma alba]|uniref:receptor-like protein EIX1 n=1 Tax=Neltuma alba TaxID=207710 RepID=UPI0010A40F07|nr:receptor-like protein EIX1 [Prosopis alba]
MGFMLKYFYALLMLLLLRSSLSEAVNSESMKKCIGRERKALLSFKQGIYADSATMLSTWRDGDDEDCCNWERVYCSKETGHVQILDLHGSNSLYLVGVINITLLNDLHDLKHLDLSCNYLYPSDIPKSIESFTNLRYLNLSHSLFVGSIPNELGKVSNLQYVDLSNNYLDGAIPWQIGNLSKLQYLHLGGNDLDGVIPYQLGNLSMLHTLQLGGYDSNLTVADKNNRDVDWISKLSSITNLGLNNVSDVGYSHLWLQIIGKLLPQLRELQLTGCGITYAHDLPSNYSSSLVVLDLSFNNLSSSLFKWPFNFSSNLQELYLRNCSLSTNDPSFLFSHFHFSSLTVLDLSYNDLMSVMKLNFGSTLQELYLINCSLSSNNLIVTSFDPNLTSLLHLDMSFNHFTSSTIFHWISNFTFNLYEVYLNNNLLGSSIPESFGNTMNSLKVLDLNSNYLQGEVPTSLGNICTLKSLTLGYNNLSGDLQSFISNTSRCDRHPLQSLYFPGNRLTGMLPDLSAFFFLQDLDLSHNKLKGKIPESLGSQSQLKYLRLNDNDLGGAITESHFRNLSNLLVLSLSYNPLALNISSSWIPPFQLYHLLMASCMIGPNFPHWLRNQHELYSLDISNGSLSGFIPEWFWQLLKDLDYMNISSNNFSGQISNLPLEFNHRPIIILTSNNFEGAVPSFFGQASELHLSKNKFSNLMLLACSQTEDGGILILDISNNQLKGHLPNC